jgi:hypothetical protein
MMAMSDTEMALALGANQLAAMRPVDPGAFSGIQPSMAPPMGGAMSDQEAMMMAGAVPPPPPPPGAMSDQEVMMMGGAAPDLNSQEGMMRYLQEKVRQIRERTGGGAMSDADMGALEAVMQSMPEAGPPMGGQK